MQRWEQGELMIAKFKNNKLTFLPGNFSREYAATVFPEKIVKNKRS